MWDQAGMLTVSFVMRLRRVLCMILGMQFVTVRDMRVMRCFLVVPVLMMPCGLMVMFCSMFVMFCRFFMMVDQL
jgi:hypothetical protein